MGMGMAQSHAGDLDGGGLGKGCGGVEKGYGGVERGGLTRWHTAPSQRQA